ncbi:MAG: dus [Chlamydiales bacterium]|jgi:nifR3 family TIM-barrel protein|nr:dus [Chlamydiales bacterium]
MNYLKKQFKLGSLELPSNIFYAPLAGCSDYPFRMMSKRHGSPGLMYCEMVKLDALVRHDANTYKLLDYHHSMHPIGAQLCGSRPELAAAAGRTLEDLGFDVIDLNCGCPVDKVTKDGSGSGLLKNPQKIGEIISNLVAVVKIPVTVKIRAGWDEQSLVTAEITEIAEQAGAVAITVHGRTREQGYKGPANWDHIKLAKQVAKKIAVIGNGDLFEPEDAKKMFAYTGCDGVLVARGTMGQPWIAQDIYNLLQGTPINQRTPAEYLQALLEHIDIISEYQEEYAAVVDIRRIGNWYMKETPGVREFRNAISRVETVQEAKDLINTLFQL